MKTGSKVKPLQNDESASNKEAPDRLGKINELRAIIEFLANGAEVFINVRQQGPIDLVVIHDSGEIEKLDVKTRSVRMRDGSPIHRSLTPVQKKLGVRFYYIDENYMGHYHPPKGLE
jgi:hypothetical protein|tara:strand:+ start:976 stop:1326 length:351 start_codon:yes stop_codon:yes gene_type:complete